MYRNEEEVGLYVEGRGDFETENAMQFRGRCLMMIMLIKEMMTVTIMMVTLQQSLDDGGQ